MNIRDDIVFTKNLKGNELTFHSTWGLFSPKEVDEGSELLLNSIPLLQEGCMLDLGCGYGPIGLTLAKLSPQSIVHMVDKDFVAIEYAKKNAKKNMIKNTEIYLSNGFDQISAELQFDVIVSNIPAKVGKELYWIMIEDAKKRLKPGGSLYFVFISGLREFFKRNFKETFGNYKTVAANKTYAVGLAVKEKTHDK
jgi:16S rRNA G1207 methylase RsmC